MQNKKIYFYCLPQGEGKLPAYQYQIIAIAEGLKELGIPFFSNVNYWKTNCHSNSFLFINDPEVTPDDCDVVVISCQWAAYNVPFPKELFKAGRKYKTVYIDVCDGLFTSSFNKQAANFDIILKQKNSKFNYPANCQSSWTYGLANHVINLAGNSPGFSERNNTICVNFRHKHSIREMAKVNFLVNLSPLLTIDNSFEELNYSYNKEQINNAKSEEELIFLQSGGRHYSNYMKRLKSSKACAAFGGGFILPFPFDTSPGTFRFGAYFSRGRAGGRIVNLMEKLNLQIKHTYRIYQWDSWRFWESLACGCVTLQVDFEKYGIELPVMPVNWKHYIGIDLKNARHDIERLLDAPDELEHIANSGRKWAMENYSPTPLAQRFLNIVSD